MTSRPELIPVTLLSALTFGGVLRLVGAIQQPLARRFGFEEHRPGIWLSVFYLSMVPMMLVSGLLVDRLGLQEMLVAGSLLSCLGIFVLALCRTARAALYAIFLIGMSETCLCVGAVVLMPEALIQSNEAAAANLGFVFFGLGALLAPALVDLLLQTVGLRRTLCLAAVVCLAPALVALLTSSSLFRTGHVSGDVWQIPRSPAFWGIAVAFLLYCPLEGTLGVWGAVYLQELGHKERQARFLAAGFWLGFLGSRVLAAILQQREVLTRTFDPWMICLLALAAMVLLGNLSGTQHRRNAAAGLFLLGALLGPIAPTLVGFLFQQFPLDRGTAFGGVFTLGTAGSLFLPPLFGFYERRGSLRQALLIPTVGAFLLAASALVLALQ